MLALFWRGRRGHLTGTAASSGYSFERPLSGRCPVEGRPCDHPVYGAYNVGSDEEWLEHFLLLDSELGISDASAQRQIRAWLERQ